MLFISSIDEYSRNRYLYLIQKKFESLEKFQNFKAKLENQLSKKIKIVKSNNIGEYYGQYDGLGEQYPGPFAQYLSECGIVP